MLVMAHKSLKARVPVGGLREAEEDADSEQM